MGCEVKHENVECGKFLSPWLVTAFAVLPQVHLCRLATALTLCYQASYSPDEEK